MTNGPAETSFAGEKDETFLPIALSVVTAAAAVAASVEVSWLMVVHTSAGTSEP